MKCPKCKSENTLAGKLVGYSGVVFIEKGTEKGTEKGAEKGIETKDSTETSSFFPPVMILFGIGSTEPCHFSAYLK